MDATPATATAEDIVTSKTAMLNNGVMTTGVGDTGVVITEEQDSHGGTIVNVDTGRKLVKFIDYDGTVVASRTRAEIDAMTSDSDLPANPTHEGLTAQGWNWTVAQLKSQLSAMPNQDVIVGQMYVTTSGDTEIDVEFVDEAALSPYFRCTVNGTITIDWGDETTPDTVTGTSLTSAKNTQHVYATTGEYTITIHVTSGTWAFYSGSETYSTLHKNSSTTNYNLIYSRCIKAIRIGNGITSIKSYAFNNCTSVKSITVPSSVVDIGSYAFRNCFSLLSITIPTGNTGIYDGTFYACRLAKFISIPSNITIIYTYAFRDCYNLIYCTIPSGVTRIGGYAFYGCYTLEFVEFPSGVTSIENYAFYQCTSLTSIVIPSGVTIIQTQTFYGCSSLKSVVIQNGVTTIKSSAFSGCYSIENITLPSSITTIEANAFYALTKISSIIIPENVTTVGNYAFAFCYSLEYAIIKSGVAGIGDGIFSNCSSLKKITIPSSVTSIGIDMFNSCNSLASIILSSGVTSIGNNAFSYCYSLGSITIPSSVTSLGNKVFQNCSNIAEYHFQQTTPPTLGTQVFISIQSNSIIYVPYSSDHSILTAYQTASNWSDYASYIQEEEV